jgi:hypothetical protein
MIASAVPLGLMSALCRTHKNPQVFAGIVGSRRGSNLNRGSAAMDPPPTLRAEDSHQ